MTYPRSVLSLALLTAFTTSGCDDIQEQAAALAEQAQQGVAASSRASAQDQSIEGSLDNTDPLMDFSRGQDQHYDRYSVPMSSGMVLIAEVTSEAFDPQIEDPDSPLFRARRSAGPIHRDAFYRFDAPSEDPMLAAAQVTESFDIMGNSAQALGAYTLRYRTFYPEQVYMLPRRRSPELTTPDPLPTDPETLGPGDIEAELSESDGMLTKASRTQLPNRPLSVIAEGFFDAYAFDAEEGQRIQLRAESRAIEPNLVLVGPDGFELENDDGSHRATVRMQATTTGRHYAIVFDDSIGAYSLSLGLR